MNIFISHSSKNADYGNALVELLTSLGIKNSNVIFTSNKAYGIPTGENIFDWLKNKIKEKPHVIYLLSPEYYRSVACLNEMGAAWVVENKHTMIFTPSFNTDCKEFHTGVLDPREIGFYINNDEKIIEFIDFLRKSMNISPNPVLVNQKIKKFLTEIKFIEVPKIEPDNLISTIITENKKIEVGKTGKYISPASSGKVTFDYSNNNGRYYIGQNEFIFELDFSKASDKRIHLHNYPASIKTIAIAKGKKEIRTIQDAGSFESSSHSRTPNINEVAVLQNTNGFYAGIKILDLKDDTRKDTKDEITFEYFIQTNGSPDFTR